MRRILCLASVACSLALPGAANAYRLYEDCPATPLDPGVEPPLRTPLAAGGEAGYSRCNDRAQHWFDLNFWAAGQFNYQEGYEASAMTNFSIPPGFRVRRARLILHGQAHRLLQVRVEADVAAGFNILDAYVLVPYHRALNFQVGQFRVPFDRQELLSSSRWQFINPNLWDDAGGGTFVPSFDIGAMVWGYVGPHDLFEYYVGIFNGDGPAQQAHLSDGFLGAARVVLNPLGRPRHFQEGDMDREGLKIQVALDAAYQSQGLGFFSPTVGSPMMQNTQTSTLLGAEFTAFWVGLSLYGEVFFRDRQDADAMSEPPTQSFGGSVAAGYFIPVDYLRDHLEVVARGEQWSPSTCLTRANNGPTCQTILPASVNPSEYQTAMETRAFTFGVNWYQLGHALKLQMDYTIFNQLSLIAGTAPGSNSGVVHDNLFTMQLLGSF